MTELKKTSRGLFQLRAGGKDGRKTVAITLTTTDVSIDFCGLTEDEHRRLMDLCFEIGWRQMIEAGEIEEKGGMVQLTEKGKLRAALDRRCKHHCRKEGNSR